MRGKPGVERNLCIVDINSSCTYFHMVLISSIRNSVKTRTETDENTPGHSALFQSSVY